MTGQQLIDRIRELHAEDLDVVKLDDDGFNTYEIDSVYVEERQYGFALKPLPSPRRELVVSTGSEGL